MKLTSEQKAELLSVLEAWHRTVGGYDGLPTGLFDLRNALIEDLRHAEQR